jgi:hypothetical protein
MRFVLAAFATLLAGVVSLALFVFLGALLPIGLMMATHGREAVQDAPGHGGIILLATLPVAGLISIPVFLFLAIKLYRVGISRYGPDRHQIGSTNF